MKQFHVYYLHGEIFIAFLSGAISIFILFPSYSPLNQTICFTTPIDGLFVQTLEVNVLIDINKLVVHCSPNTFNCMYPNRYDIK